jgi:hypothetical protein
MRSAIFFIEGMNVTTSSPIATDTCTAWYTIVVISFVAWIQEQMQQKYFLPQIV